MTSGGKFLGYAGAVAGLVTAMSVPAFAQSTQTTTPPQTQTHTQTQTQPNTPGQPSTATQPCANGTVSGGLGAGTQGVTTTPGTNMGPNTQVQPNQNTSTTPTPQTMNSPANPASSTTAPGTVNGNSAMAGGSNQNCAGTSGTMPPANGGGTFNNGSTANGAQTVNGQPMNALTNNPNGSNWLSKFNRPTAMSHARWHKSRKRTGTPGGGR